MYGIGKLDTNPGGNLEIKNPYVSLVIPVMNEVENLDELYRRLTNTLRKETKKYEIIFVDDGSTDGTVLHIEKLREKDSSVKAIVFSRNFGHQAALKAGLEHASGEVCITMDGDLQHPPEVIPEFLQKWREGYQIISGAKKGSGGRGTLKSILASLYYKMIRKLSSVEIDPHVSDFRLLDRVAIDSIRELKESTLFLRGMVKWVGFRSVIVPYEPAERFRGEAKYSLRKLLHLGASGVFAFSVFPLRLASIVGLGITAFGATYALFSIFFSFFYGKVIEGWTSLMVVTLFLGGGNLIFMGILGEYIGKTFMETKKRPLYIVSRKVGVEDIYVPSP